MNLLYFQLLYKLDQNFGIWIFFDIIDIEEDSENESALADLYITFSKAILFKIAANESVYTPPLKTVQEVHPQNESFIGSVALEKSALTLSTSYVLQYR